MISHSSLSTVKSEKAVYPYFLSKQILHFGFTERYSTDIFKGIRPAWEINTDPYTLVINCKGNRH